jgi:hypothetical protein
MVAQAVKDMNIHPSQLYSLDNLKADREFAPTFEQLSTFEAENERLTKENEQFKTESQDSVKKANIATAKSRLDDKLKEGFTDKQKSFIEKRFDPEKLGDADDEALDSFIEDSKKDFAETAKLFGVTEGGSGPDPNPDPQTVEEEEEAVLKAGLKAIGVGNG